MPKVIENLWDCTSCGSTRILGRHKKCPSCGDPRNQIEDPAEKPYLPDHPESMPAVTDPELLELAGAGPDWMCMHCFSSNRGDAGSCNSCGHARDEEDPANRRITYSLSDIPALINRQLDTRTRYVESDYKETVRLTSPHEEEPYQLADADLTPWRRAYQANRKPVVFGGIGLLVVVLGLSLFFTIRHFTTTTPGTVTVQELSWVRQVEVERYVMLDQDGWSHPADAFDVDSRSEIRSYKTVHDGWRTETYTDYESRSRQVPDSFECGSYVDNGNGFSSFESKTCYTTRTEYYSVPVTKTRQVEVTHEEPVYDTKYYYKVNRWVTGRWVTADGDTPMGLSWPEELNLATNDDPGDQLGEERKGDDRQATYTIVYVDRNGQSFTLEDDNIDLWQRLEVGEVIEADYRAHNGKLARVNWDSVSETG